PMYAPRPLDTCCIDALALMNAPRRRGSTLLVTIARAAIIRPTLNTNSAPNTLTATATGTGGKCVINSSHMAENGIVTWNSRSLPYLSASRPQIGEENSVSAPPTMYTSGSCSLVMPTFETRYTLRYGKTLKPPTMSTMIKLNAVMCPGCENVSTTA